MDLHPPTLYVTTDVHVASADGTLDVESELELAANALTDDAVGWNMLASTPLEGVVPEALVEAADLEQDDHCPADADERPNVRVYLSRLGDEASLHFDAQYRHRNVCNYGASLASAALVRR